MKLKTSQYVESIQSNMEAVENLATCSKVFHIFGLLYFSIKKLSTENINTYPSVLYTVQFILILTVFSFQALLFFNNLSKMYAISISAKSSLSLVVQSLSFLGIFFVYAVAAIQSYFSTPKLKKIFKNLIVISKIFSDDFGYILSYRAVKIWFFKRTVALSIVYFLSHLLVFAYELKFDGKDILERNVLAFLLTIFLTMIVQKFLFFVNLVDYNLKHLIILMKKISRIQNSRRKKKLEKLRKVYNLIQENVELINQCLGLTTLNHILNIAFVNVTFIYDLFLICVGDHDVGLAAGNIIKNLFTLYEIFISAYQRPRS